MANVTKIIGGLKSLMTHSGDKALPLALPRANVPSAYINQQAERVARQMLGEHVTSGKARDTTNLAGRSMKESQRVKGLDYKVTPTGTVAEEVVHTPRVGDINVGTVGDQTISDSMLESVGDIYGINSQQEGGGKYALGQRHIAQPEWWKSTKEPADRFQRKVNRLNEFYEPDRLIGTHVAMGPTSNNFAMHLADANMKAVDWSKVTPENIASFDDIIRTKYRDPKTKQRVLFPEWPGLADQEGAFKAMQENPLLRKWFNDRMKTPKVTKPLGLPNGLDIQYAITEPSLRDMEINMTGLMTGELQPNALTEIGGSPHNTYSTRILSKEGTPVGGQEVLTPFTLAYPDASQHIATTQRPADFTGTIQKVVPHQIVDDQFINQYNQYRERIKELTGKKKGGEVRKHGHSFEEDLAAAFAEVIAEHNPKPMHGEITVKTSAPVKMGVGGAVAKAMREANLAKFLAPSAEKRRMYHVSKEPNITEFKSRHQMTEDSHDRDAVFLSPKPEFTNSFARGEGTTTYPVYAQIEKPFDFDNPEHLNKVKETYLDMYHNPDSDLYDHYMLPSERSMAIHTFNKRVDNLPDDENNWARIENQDFQDVLKDLGFDSFYTREQGTKNLGVYDGSRIKSAIGNRGTYDINESDMSKANGGLVHMGAGGKIVKGLIGVGRRLTSTEKAASDAIGKAAESAGVNPPVMADKMYPPLTNLQDFHTSLMDNVREGVVKAKKEMDLFDYKYAPGQHVFTEHGAKNNLPPLKIMEKSRVGNMIVREDPNNPFSKSVIDPETGKSQRTPYEPGYRVRRQGTEGTEDWSEFVIPQTAIKGDVEMAKGGGLRMAMGGAVTSDYNTVPDDNDGGAIIQNPSNFAKGGRASIMDALDKASDEETLDRKMERYLNRVRLSGSGGKDAYGTNVGGSLGLDIPLSKDVTISPYLEGYTYKPTNQPIGGQVTGAGANLTMRFKDGGVAQQRNIDELHPIHMGYGGLAKRALRGLKGTNVAEGNKTSIVKDTGGNWLGGNVEKHLSPLQQGSSVGPPVAERIAKHRQELLNPDLDEEGRRIVQGLLDSKVRNQALDKWIDNNLTKYIKNQMGTAEDPVRKLAEQNIIHTSPEVYGGGYGRSQYGMPQLGVSPRAQAWENLTDTLIDQSTVADQMDIQRLFNYGKEGVASHPEPWMAKVSPYTKVYGISETTSPRNFGYDHILDVLREDLTTGRLLPENLNKMNMELAVRRTYQYDQELAKRMSEASILAREGLPVLKEYPKTGFRWLELNKPGSFAAESDAMGHSARGYEPPKGHPDWVEGSGNAGYEDYGLGGWEAIKSGKAKMYSLVDKEGKSHATIETEKFGGKDSLLSGDAFNKVEPGLFQTYLDQRQNGGIDGMHQWLREKRPDIAEMHGITQIKPPGNYWDSDASMGRIAENPKYMEDIQPYLQDFVKTGKWSSVNDLHNTGLIQHDSGKYISKAEMDALSRKHFGESSGNKPDASESPEQYFGRVSRYNQEQLSDADRAFVEDWKAGNFPPQEEMAKGGLVHMAPGGVVKWASQLAKTINSHKMESMSGEQWMKWLNANAPKSAKKEALASGTLDWLPQQGKVSKGAIIEHMKANAPQIKVKKFYENHNPELQARYADLHDTGWTSGLTHAEREEMQELELKLEPTTKFHDDDYRLPGGSNYREMTLSARNPTGDNYIVPGAHTYGITEADVNRILHMRMNDRPHKGGKALNIEELQSDWAQRGRSEGFQKPLQRISEETADRHNTLTSKERNKEATPEELLELAYIRLQLHPKINRGLPSGPYVTDTEDWTKLGLRNAIKEAIEQGHNAVTWTGGEAQAKRYDLSKHLDRIDHNLNADGTYNLSAIKNGSEVFSQENIPAEQLAEHVGKDAADKIIKGEGVAPSKVDKWEAIGNEDYPNLKSLTGLDLQVGGEGMKGYYNQIMQYNANDILKKEMGLAERVSDFDVGTGVPHQGFNITPEMIDYVEQNGLQRFQDGGQAHYNKAEQVVESTQDLIDKFVEMYEKASGKEPKPPKEVFRDPWDMKDGGAAPRRDVSELMPFSPHLPSAVSAGLDWVKGKVLDEAKTYSNPRAIPDVAANVAADWAGMPVDIAKILADVADYGGEKVAHAITGRSSKKLSDLVKEDEHEKPTFGSSEYIKDYLKEKGVTTGTERPISEFAAFPVAPALLRGATRTGKKYLNQPPHLTQKEYDDILSGQPPRKLRNVDELIPIHMGVGGIAKAIKPSELSKLKSYLLQRQGTHGAQRVERASDEVPNLESMYSPEALEWALGKYNPQTALGVIKPSDFEKYAAPIPSSSRNTSGRATSAADMSKYNTDTDEYVKYLQSVKGFSEVPMLQFDKGEVGLPIIPSIRGHEGRHRNRALANSGEQSSLVVMAPHTNLRSELPNKGFADTHEQFLKALNKEMEMTDNMVTPQTYTIPRDNDKSIFEQERRIIRPNIRLPEMFSEGGVASKRNVNELHPLY